MDLDGFIDGAVDIDDFIRSSLCVASKLNSASEPLIRSRQPPRPGSSRLHSPNLSTPSLPRFAVCVVHRAGSRLLETMCNACHEFRHLLYAKPHLTPESHPLTPRRRATRRSLDQIPHRSRNRCQMNSWRAVRQTSSTPLSNILVAAPAAGCLSSCNKSDLAWRGGGGPCAEIWAQGTGRPAFA